MIYGNRSRGREEVDWWAGASVMEPGEQGSEESKRYILP